MTIQTTYAFDRAIGYPGGIADSGPRDVKSVVAAVIIAAGLLVVQGATRAKGYLPTTPDVADVDAIIATGASTAGVQNVSGASLDGVVGQGEMAPARNLVLVLSSHANWDLSVATVTGVDSDGKVISEDFPIPDAGNVTVTGTKHFAKVTNLRIPAQSGTAGTYTLGTGSSLGPINGRFVHGVALYDASREPEAYPVNYVVPCVRKGRVFVTSETSYSDGDPVFVRFVATGDEVAGQFRNAADSTDCALLEGARFRGTGSAGVAIIDLDL